MKKVQDRLDNPQPDDNLKSIFLLGKQTNCNTVNNGYIHIDVALVDKQTINKIAKELGISAFNKNHSKTFREPDLSESSSDTSDSNNVDENTDLPVFGTVELSPSNNLMNSSCLNEDPNFLDQPSLAKSVNPACGAVEPDEPTTDQPSTANVAIPDAIFNDDFIPDENFIDQLYSEDTSIVPSNHSSEQPSLAKPAEYSIVSQDAYIDPNLSDHLYSEQSTDILEQPSVAAPNMCFDNNINTQLIPDSIQINDESNLNKVLDSNCIMDFDLNLLDTMDSNSTHMDSNPQSTNQMSDDQNIDQSTQPPEQFEVVVPTFKVVPIYPKKHHPCEHCDRKFASIKARERHDKYCKEKLSNLHCKMCEKSFSTVSKAKRHKLTHLSLAERRKYECPQCHTQCTTADSLSNHEKRCINGIFFSCDCGRKFCYQQHLRIHKAKEKCKVKLL